MFRACSPCVHGPQFVPADETKSDQTQGEQQHAQSPKKVHGLSRKTRHESNGHQIQKAVHKPLHAEFGRPIFSALMLNHLLSNAIEARIFGQNRDVTMHFALDFNGLYDLQVDRPSNRS